MFAVLSDASHGKLLIQVEEAINTRLNDAQRKINTVQKVTSLTILISVIGAMLHAFLC